MKLTREARDIIEVKAVAVSDWTTGAGRNTRKRQIPQCAMEIDVDSRYLIDTLPKSVQVAVRKLLKERPRVRRLVVLRCTPKEVVKAYEKANTPVELDLLLNAPIGVYSEVKKWPVQNKSPYSLSVYNTKKVGWNHKEEGSLRVSNHWNWDDDDDGKACETLCGHTDGWALGIRENGVYRILNKFTKGTNND